MKAAGERQLAAVRAWFEENFTLRGELGAALSIWHKGREVLSLAGGYADRARTQPWGEETPVLVWSATKGPAAACLLHALERQGEGLDLPVRELWPELARHGKEGLSVGEVLSHRAGLAALDDPAPLTEREAVLRALEAQPPNWPPGQGHGYHPRTFGYLLDELVRRLEGRSLADYWRQWFGVPLGLDFWIGVPDEVLPRVATICAARAFRERPEPGAEDARFFAAMADPQSLTARAFASPRGALGVAGMNTREIRQGEFPGFGGIGTARGLARFYAMLAGGGVLEGVRCLRSIAPWTRALTEGEDRVLLRETAFAAGMMLDPIREGRKTRHLFGPSLTAFGQPGAGGSHAFADPENGIAFAYCMNQMEPGVFPGEKALGLVRALYG